ncbi:MAG: rubredoxin, partial [Planctomycetota bacterium]
NCPKCGAPKEKFSLLPEDKAKLIERSRFTNDLHMKLETLMNKVIKITEKGIQDNLDPTCVSLFNKTRIEADIIKQMIKAEIQAHMNKGKWG